MKQMEKPQETSLEQNLKQIDKIEEGEDRSPRKKIIGIIVAFLLLGLFHFGPTFSGLKPQGQSILGVFVWFITVMVTDALPGGIVGLATPLLMVILGGQKIPAAFKAFTSGVFFLGAGAFVIAGIMMGTPLGKRIAITIVTKMKSNKVTRILMGLGLADIAVGGVMPTVSESALFLPVAKSIGNLMRGREDLPEAKRINTALLLQTPGLTPLFTGTLILTSHFPNIILAAALKDAVGIEITWAKWFWLNLPLWGLIPIMFLYVYWYFDLWKLNIPGAEVEIPKMKAELGRITWPEIYGLICVGIGLFLWITESTLHNVDSGMTALIVAALLFMPWGGMDFKKVNKNVMWDTLMLLGGSISLGLVLYDVGVVKWLADMIVGPLKGWNLSPIPMLFVLVFAMHIARAGVVSAVAMGAAFVPLTIGMAKTLGVSVLPFTLVTINCLSYAFFLPISITAFLIAWAASGASGWTAVRFGAPLTVISNVYVILVQTGWLALIGYPL
jgi:sodium-dependent dicarboxylate transporter 2/3/5